jgi:hypothetical protein
VISILERHQRKVSREASKVKGETNTSVNRLNVMATRQNIIHAGTLNKLESEYMGQKMHH